jgi:tRNA threonylcarbamoyladenosine biosynthesis protein TsaE
MRIELPDELSTQYEAKRIAVCLTFPLTLTFSGEIGAGKTTFIRAMLRALGIKSAIKSPTFSLVETYHYEQKAIHHFDLYRLHDEDELEYIGFRDYFQDNSLCCIEWSERASQSLQQHVDINFAFAFKGNGRELIVKALSSRGELVLACVGKLGM